MQAAVIKRRTERPGIGLHIFRSAAKHCPLTLVLRQVTSQYYRSISYNFDDLLMSMLSCTVYVLHESKPLEGDPALKDDFKELFQTARSCGLEGGMPLDLSDEINTLRQRLAFADKAEREAVASDAEVFGSTLANRYGRQIGIDKRSTEAK